MLIICCRNSVIEPRSRRASTLGRPVAMKSRRALPDSGDARRRTYLQLRKHDLGVVDLDEIDIGHALAAFLAGRALLLELDLAVKAHQFGLPQRFGDRGRLSLARLLDRSRDGADAVIAAE